MKSTTSAISLEKVESVGPSITLQQLRERYEEMRKEADKYESLYTAYSGSAPTTTSTYFPPYVPSAPPPPLAIGPGVYADRVEVDYTLDGVRSIVTIDVRSRTHIDMHAIKDLPREVVLEILLKHVVNATVEEFKKKVPFE